MMELKQNRHYKTALAVIGTFSVLLLTYTGYRAATISFTIDESQSFNDFVPLSFMDIVSFRIVSANNHLINTLLLKCTSLLFGTSELALRLPSVIGHLLYIVFTFRLVRNRTQPILMLSGFLLLNLNPYLLDFFSLARGYAMANAFVVASLYYLLNHIRSENRKALYLSLLFAAVAVLSSFSVLPFFISLLLVLNFHWLMSYGLRDPKTMIRKNFPVIVCTLVLVAILFEPLRKLSTYGALYDGGRTGLWHDTVGSLVRTFLYDQPYSAFTAILLKAIAAGTAVIMAVAITLKIYARKLNMATSRFTVPFLLLIFSATLTSIQHHILNTNYLIDRMALYMTSLFVLSVVFFLEEHKHKFRWRSLTTALPIIIVVLLTVHSGFSLNPSYVLNWRFDAATKEMLSDLAIIRKKHGQSSVKLGIDWIYEPTINFYRNTKDLHWLEKVTRDKVPGVTYDYHYLNGESYQIKNKADILHHYPLSDSYLIKPSRRSAD